MTNEQIKKAIAEEFELLNDSSNKGYVEGFIDEDGLSTKRMCKLWISNRLTKGQWLKMTTKPRRRKLSWKPQRMPNSQNSLGKLKTI